MFRELPAVKDATYIEGAWTPAIAQNGARTVTITYAKYWRTGGLCYVECNVTITNAGTAGNAIILSGLPIAPITTGLCVGTFMYTDAGTSLYVGAAYLQGVNDMEFYAHNLGSALGIAPSFATANTDVLRVSAFWPVS